MTVLIVDDQVSILSGLISGVNWDCLGVTSIRTATSAAKAKDILLAEQVDVLLCDIEMPGENGLSLLRWVRSRGMDLVCVFLTSHADFLYAKEAIQLECFDYVLQPARYENIQETVKKAIARVKSGRAEKRLEQYGSIVRSNAPDAFRYLFSDWLSGGPLSVQDIVSAVRQMGHHINENTECFVILSHLIRWHKEPWTFREWTYAVNNMVTELYEAAGYGVLPFTVDRLSLGWMFFPAGRVDIDAADYLKTLSQVNATIREHMPFDMAFYAAPAEPLKSLSEPAARLLRQKKDNVLQRSGIVTQNAEGNTAGEAFAASSKQVRRWEDLMSARMATTLKEEIRRYFENVSTMNKLNHQFLRNFWLQFQQTALNALWSLSLGMTPELQRALDKGGNAQSVAEVLEAVSEVAALFQQPEQYHSDGEAVNRAKNYIESHMDQPLSVSSVADALFMNPDYLSRLFRSKYGVSLKKYIINEKMKTARNYLRTTTLPISTIAMKLGYDNFPYFSQVYQKVMGVSPSDERKTEQ